MQAMKARKEFKMCDMMKSSAKKTAPKKAPAAKKMTASKKAW